jgi:hypothetical protein
MMSFASSFSRIVFFGLSFLNGHFIAQNFTYYFRVTGFFRRRFLMRLDHLSDSILDSEIRRMVKEERERLTILLYHLLEFERRRLFSNFGCGSLFDYGIKELKFSDNEINPRIAGMRMLRDVPAIGKKIASGDLSLTNIALARRTFSKEKKAGREFEYEAKVELLKSLENKRTRAALKIVAEVAPSMKLKDELTYDSISDDELREKLLRVKGKYAHSHPDMSLIEPLHMFCDKDLAESPCAQTMLFG